MASINRGETNQETNETMTNEMMDDPKLGTQQRHVGKAS